jgi:hypothetical protein
MGKLYYNFLISSFCGSVFLFNSCSSGSLPADGNSIKDQYCDLGYCIRLGNVFEEETKSMQYTFIFTRTDKAQTQIIDLLDGLDNQLENDFRFNFQSYVKLVTKQDTIPAVFSHLESNGNIGGETVQIVGFDSESKPQKGDKITYNDIFFTHKVYAFEL